MQVGSYVSCQKCVCWSELTDRELQEESYGVELLHAIGRAYQAKTSQHMVSRSLLVLPSRADDEASSQFAPLGWFHGAKNSFNVVTDT